MADQNLDELLRDWPYDPRSLSVRLCEGDDGRELIQMRIDMGVLQLEVTGRPDGNRPGGCETYLDFLNAEFVRQGEDFELDEDQCLEVEREFVQFYHRRISWLRLHRYHNAVADADHTLELMDFCIEYSPDEHWTLSHEQYRPFVLFHRTQAAALSALEEDGAETAVQEVNEGLDRLKDLFVEHEADENFEDDELVARLVEMRESLRTTYDVGRTLNERLADAVAAEQYELAARLRDEMNRRDTER